MAHPQARSASRADPDLYDTVRVLRDLPGADSRYGAPTVSLPTGAVGVVVHVHDDAEDGSRAYEVEFLDEAGRTVGVHTLREDEFRVVDGAMHGREDGTSAA